MKKAFASACVQAPAVLVGGFQGSFVASIGVVPEHAPPAAASPGGGGGPLSSPPLPLVQPLAPLVPDDDPLDPLVPDDDPLDPLLPDASLLPEDPEDPPSCWPVPCMTLEQAPPPGEEAQRWASAPSARIANRTRS